MEQEVMQVQPQYGANTRKYHGLLIAPLSPPGKRNLILSKVDESIEIAGKKYDIYTNIGKNYITEGYKYQMSFEKEYVPIYTYKIQDVIIRKYICMQYGKNTVTILYRVFNGKDKSKLILTPIVNFRDFHKDTYNHEFVLAQWQKNRKLKLVVEIGRAHV